MRAKNSQHSSSSCCIRMTQTNAAKQQRKVHLAHKKRKKGAKVSRRKPEESKSTKKTKEEKEADPWLHTITDDFIKKLPLGSWDGHTRVLNTFAEMKTAVDEILATSEECLGFDIESQPNYRPKCFNPPALLQIATESTVYLFRLCNLHGDRKSNSRQPHNENFSFLLPLLTTPSIIKAGVGIQNDMKDMQSLLHFQAAGVCPLEDIVKDFIRPHSLKALAAHFLQLQIPKSRSVTMSNWAAEESLSERQIQYAASDAWLGRAIWYAMREAGYDMQKTKSTPRKQKKHNYVLRSKRQNQRHGRPQGENERTL